MIYKRNFITQVSRIIKGRVFRSEMRKVARDNMTSQGSSPSVLPRDDLKISELYSLPDCIDVSKSEHKSGNPSSDDSHMNSKDLPKGNLKNSLSPPLENITANEYSIQSAGV